MALNFNEVPKKEYPQAPVGTYGARIVQIVDFGKQAQTDWKPPHGATDPKNRVYVSFEIPELRIETEKDDGTILNQPQWVGKEFTISTFGESGLMQMVNALKPDASGMADLLGMPAMITIGRTSGGKAKVTTISGTPNGFDVPELENDTTYYDTAHPTEETFKSCKPWQQKNILKALDYDGSCDAWYEAPAEQSDY